MRIGFALSGDDVARRFPVMSQLRPHLVQQEFAERVARQKQAGYRLVFIEDAGKVKAVAGFRVLEMPACGRFPYVDDLVTDEAERSKGFGGALFDWLVRHAESQDCAQLHPDSGVHRARAHRFYFQRHMRISDFHFALKLRGESPA